MASEQIDEYEQGERVRSWLRDNGSSLLTGVMLGLALIAGWNWWQGRGLRHGEEASTQYAALSDAIDAKDDAKVKAFGAVLDAKYQDTPFAALSHLRQAAYLQQAGKTADAIATLKSAPASRDPALSELVHLREARLHLLAGKPADALAVVASIKASNYPAILAELRGDALLAQGKRDDARKAYEDALTTLDQAAPTRRLVELKLIDAGGKTPVRPEA
jgi:predicted negative regulator of RcsB-dependent stress response